MFQFLPMLADFALDSFADFLGFYFFSGKGQKTAKSIAIGNSVDSRRSIGIRLTLEFSPG
jgi:hypothetical protein